MTNPSEKTLAELSAEASKGLLTFEDGSSYALPSGEYIQPKLINEDGETVFDEMYPDDAKFVRALWNKYRSGHLIEAGWRTDMDNCPEGHAVLIWGPDYPCVFEGSLEGDGGWFIPNSAFGQSAPTHWRYLPDPPITSPTQSAPADSQDGRVSELEAEVQRLRHDLGRRDNDLGLLLSTVYRLLEDLGGGLDREDIITVRQIKADLEARAALKGAGS